MAKASATPAQVRAAVSKGKTITLRPYPHTKVVVTSTSADEAEIIVRTLQPAMPSDADYERVMLLQLHLLFQWVVSVAPDDARDWLDVMDWELGNDR